MTQHDKILTVMGRDKTGYWFFPYDFMRPGMDYFVGYEASARLSELAKLYPGMIESRRDGKYFKRRINFETAATWYPFLSNSTKDLIKWQAPPQPKPVVLPRQEALL